MDSAGTFNSNTRTGIETRIWFNQLSEDSSVLIGALKKLVSKNISLATIFKCQPVSLTIARYYFENTTGVPMQNIMRALTFGDVRPSDFHWGRRAWGNSTNEPAKEISNSDSCYVTLTHSSINSKMPKENFKIEVLAMIGNVTQISVNMGFVYSKEPSFIPREINNYKKTSCRYWNKTQTCKYGVSCTFAHGDHAKLCFAILFSDPRCADPCLERSNVHEGKSAITRTVQRSSLKIICKAMFQRSHHRKSLYFYQRFL